MSVFFPKSDKLRQNECFYFYFFILCQFTLNTHITNVHNSLKEKENKASTSASNRTLDPIKIPIHAKGCYLMMRLMPSTNPFGASPSWGTGVRNVFRNDFVKIVNLGIHNKQLYHNFSLFGDILSCKGVLLDDAINALYKSIWSQPILRNGRPQCLSQWLCEDCKPRYPQQATLPQLFPLWGHPLMQGYHRPRVQQQVRGLRLRPRRYQRGSPGLHLQAWRQDL